jgi:hypothetical protein
MVTKVSDVAEEAVNSGRKLLSVVNAFALKTPTMSVIDFSTIEQQSEACVASLVLLD